MTQQTVDLYVRDLKDSQNVQLRELHRLPGAVLARNLHSLQRCLPVPKKHSFKCEFYLAFPCKWDYQWAASPGLLGKSSWLKFLFERVRSRVRGCYGLLKSGAALTASPAKAILPKGKVQSDSILKLQQQGSHDFALQRASVKLTATTVGREAWTPTHGENNQNVNCWWAEENEAWGGVSFIAQYQHHISFVSIFPVLLKESFPIPSNVWTPTFTFLQAVTFGF